MEAVLTGLATAIPVILSVCGVLVKFTKDNVTKQDLADMNAIINTRFDMVDDSIAKLERKDELQSDEIGRLRERVAVLEAQSH